MNPMTNVKNITKLNEREIQLGINASCSWHKIYQKSPWVFVGGLDYDLTEGDVICIFSQYGEVKEINLIRDKKTGKSKGFGFLCYENNKSTILAVDNFNGIKLCGRTIRVDHVANYRPPKQDSESEESNEEEDIMDIIDPKRKKGKKKKRGEEKEKPYKTKNWDRDRDRIANRYHDRFDIKREDDRGSQEDRGARRMAHGRSPHRKRNQMDSDSDQEVGRHPKRKDRNLDENDHGSKHGFYKNHR
ncbi:RNA-binding motif protein, X-linked 2-like [Centruroides sculpturatus]|uniref:RNA-binding motif protein, X-linked 2-like n=1 Tax=Centruroides sculpturatus TaxID=218467 RepID=UPI000C6DC705|nr:RNA-binding motif protein, X-linked 2-like [Centruroides sculpturatus]